MPVIEAIAAIMKSVSDPFTKILQGGNDNTNFHNNQTAGYTGYVMQTQSTECVHLNNKINIEVEGCTGDAKSGFTGLFTNYNNAHSKCNRDINAKYTTQLQQCAATNRQPKKNNTTIYIGAIIGIIILIIIFKK
jgi:hypothetical protein